jgi:phosphodiesterase/alkaline phosphatase D-like protein
MVIADMQEGPDGADDPAEHVDVAVEFPELPRQLRLSDQGLHVARRLAFLLAIGAAAFMYFDERLGWLDYRPGGAAFFGYVRPAFFAVLAVGTLLAIRWEAAGAVVGGFAAGAIGAFAVEQLVAWDAFTVIALLAMPAALWVVIDLNGRTRGRALVALLVAFTATAAGCLSGIAIYDRVYGPTHPASLAPELPTSLVRWVWSGGVTSTQADVRARLEDPDAESVQLAVWEPSKMQDARRFEADRRDRGIAGFTADGLAPGTEYRYAVEVDGRRDTIRSGAFTTFPEGPTSFRFTVGGCARNGSNGRVFDAIAADAPLLHLIVGDFHYGDIPDDDRERYDDVLDLTLSQPGQAALYASTPIAYVWDDHDYGVNDSDFGSPSRRAAMDAYRANVPSYPLAGSDSPIYQRFDVGRVRFLLTDARSAREPGVTMLGERQLAWFLDELVTAARESALVVWVNPVPWIAPASSGADNWGGYPDEREQIADVIARHSIDNLLMVSGDAHMVAIDDGTNTDYSSEGRAGFPLVHAAPLDRPASIKGGPYSEGAVAEPGQYARVDVTDDGTDITVQLVALRWDGQVQLSYSFDVADR